MAVTRVFFKGDSYYVGPDHSTHDGAMALAKRLTRFWTNKGEARKYEAFYICGASTQSADKAVWGVRRVQEIVPVAYVPPPVEWFRVGDAPRQKIKRLIAETAAVHGLRYNEAMRGTGKKALAVRAECMRAVYDLRPQRSFPEVAAIFGCHHSAVIYAVDDRYRERVVSRNLARHHRIKAERVAA